MRRAVVDVGSNSVLLTIGECLDGAWHPVFETSCVTGLGDGTKQTGLIGARGSADTLAALAEAFTAAQSHGAVEVRAAVTMAGRIAKNAHEFLAAAAAQHTPCFVLSGQDEAQLGLLAVVDDPAFVEDQRLTIIDVGGHSTELATADRGKAEPIFRQSFAIGTLGLRSLLNDVESLDGLTLLRASKMIDDTIGAEYLPHECGRVVALGASATNLVTVRERMLVWDPARVHGVWLDYEEVSKAAGWLGPMTDAERAAVPGLELGRERTIHLGALILERFLYAVHTLGCTVSVRGWRHAMLAQDRWFETR